MPAVCSSARGRGITPTGVRTTTGADITADQVIGIGLAMPTEALRRTVTSAEVIAGPCMRRVVSTAEAFMGVAAEADK